LVSLGTLVKYKKPEKYITPKPARSEYENLHKAKQRREEWKGDRTQLQRIDANERDRRAWRRYSEHRDFQYSQLKKSNPAVGRLESWLRRVRETGVEAYSRRDCDVDLVHGVKKLGLERTLGFREAWLVYEQVAEWLATIAREQGTYQFDDSGPFFEEAPEPTALDEVRAVLGVS